MTGSAANPANDPTANHNGGDITGPGNGLHRSGGAYSRFANAMRIALPIIAGAIIILVVAWPQLAEKPKRFSLGVTKVTVNDTGGQQIVNARFTGTDDEQRPYTITADTASQVQKSPDLIDLAFPKADVTMENGAWLALSAESGRLHRKSQMLDLKGAVNLFHDTGYELHTTVARIDLGKGVASGDTPVSGQGPFGTLKSTGFQILDRGKRLIFSGRSTLVLFPSEKGPKG